MIRKGDGKLFPSQFFFSFSLLSTKFVKWHFPGDSEMERCKCESLIRCDKKDENKWYKKGDQLKK